MDDLTGKVIFIAGAVGPLGVAFAAEFCAKGAGSVLIDGEIGDAVALALRCEEIEARYGRLDLVIVCSGTVSPPLPPEVLPVFETARRSPSLLERWRGRLMASGASGRRAVGN